VNFQIRGSLVPRVFDIFRLDSFAAYSHFVRNSQQRFELR
jgi:hypothetical protein